MKDIKDILSFLLSPINIIEVKIQILQVKHSVISLIKPSSMFKYIRTGIGIEVNTTSMFLEKLSLKNLDIFKPVAFLDKIGLNNKAPK